MSTYWVDLLHADVYRIEARYTTRVIEAGAGPALLLLHGTGGHAENYARNISAFAKHFRVLAIDFLWHGRSQTNGFNEQILPSLKDQVLDVMDTLGVEQAHIEGQSMGGWVAMLFALAYPDRVSRLVLTTPMGYRPSRGAVPGYIEPDPTPLRESSLEVLRNPTLQNVRARLARILYDAALLPDEAVAVRHAFYNDPAVNAVQQKFITHYLGGDGPRQYQVTAEMAGCISAPTLVYWADHNPTPESVGRDLARTIPNARYFCSPKTGHWAQFENHETHNREVLDFLLRAHAPGMAAADASTAN